MGWNQTYSYAPTALRREERVPYVNAQRPGEAHAVHCDLAVGR